MVGRYIGQESPDPSLTAQAQKALATPASSQSFSLLVVGIDDLANKKARLECIWWLMIDVQNTQVVLMPIYPAYDPPYNDIYAKPHQASTVDPLDLLNLGKMGMIKDRNITWEYAAFVDAYAINTAIEISGEKWEESQDIPHSSLLDSAPKSWQEPAAALQFQHGLLQFFCSHSKAFTQPAAAQRILSLFGTHIYTDIQSDQITLLWDTINHQDKKIKCRFPWSDQ